MEKAQEEIQEALGLRIHKKKIFVRNKWIQTYRFGEGERTVLVLPSFPHSGLYFAWLFAKHDLSKLRVIAFDLPGWVGESDDYKKDEKYNIEDVLEIAHAVVNHFRPNDLRILGYSFGASIGLRLACELGKIVKKLILVSALVFGDTLHNNEFYPVVKRLKRFSLGFLIKYHVESVFRKYKTILQKEGLNGEFLENYKKLIGKSDSRILLESIYSVFFTDMSSYLRELRGVKIMVVNSTDENKMFREQAKMIRLKLNNEESIHIHGGHSDFVLKPNDEVINHIIHFLSH